MKPRSDRKRQNGSADMGLVLKVIFAGLVLSAVIGIQGWIKHYRMRRDGYTEVFTDDASTDTSGEQPTYITY